MNLLTYYLYYNCGYCNQGDHDCDLEEFQSYPLAAARADQLKTMYGEGTIRIINGNSVMSVDW